MKQSEAIRIPALLATRQPRPTWEEVTVENTRMLVIIGDEVDTVIRYRRSGGVDMPQLASYPEVAESGANADERLAKQRASGRVNSTGEGVDWPRNWKLASAKAAGKIWYAGSNASPKSEASPVGPVASITIRVPSSGLDPSAAAEKACRRLADVAKGLAQREQTKLKLEELRRCSIDLEKPDFVWRSLVESFSSMGNSRGYEGLFGDPESYERIAFDALSRLSPARRLETLSQTLHAATVRMPDMKAEWLDIDFKKIEAMGGLAEAKSQLLSQAGRDAKIEFLKRFKGIGDKYARNIFMNVYHPEFRQSIAIDSRIQSVAIQLGLNELKKKKYEEQEQFFLEVAEAAGVDGWDLDRIIYHFQDKVLAGLLA